MPLERGEQVQVAVAGHGLAGRLERGRLDPGQLLRLRDVEDSHETEADKLLLLLALCGPVGLAAAVADRGEDANARLALPDATAELEPLAEPGNMRRMWTLKTQSAACYEASNGGNANVSGASAASPRW